VRAKKGGRPAVTTRGGGDDGQDACDGPQERQPGCLMQRREAGQAAGRPKNRSPKEQRKGGGKKREEAAKPSPPINATAQNRKQGRGALRNVNTDGKLVPLPVSTEWG